MPRRIGRAATFYCVCCLSCQGSTGEVAPGVPPFEVEVTSVTFCEAAQVTDSSPAPGGAAREGTVGVKVRLTGRYESGIPANYFYASLLSRDGTRYLAATEGCRPLLAGPPLQPGEVREGYVNFPLQAKKGADRLAYAPNLDHTTFADRLSTEDLSAEAALP